MSASSAGKTVSVPVLVLTNPSFDESLSTPPNSRRNSMSTGKARRDSTSSSDSSNQDAICSPTTSSVLAAAKKQREGLRGRRAARVGPAVVIVDEDGNSKVAPESVPSNESRVATRGAFQTTEREDVDYDAIEVHQESPAHHDLLHPSAAEVDDMSSRRTSDVSLYQQQKRVRLSIPCEPCHLTVPDNNNEPPDPSSRANIFKRRSAVHGLSPNTGLSIGAVM